MNSKEHLENKHFKISILVALFLLISLNACKNTKKENIQYSNLESKNYIEVISTGMNFKMVDQINSGWTTFRYSNKSNETHFFILEKLSDGVGIEKYQKEFLSPFKKAYNYFIEGDIITGNKQFKDLPAWSTKMEICGAVTLTSSKKTSETTLSLQHLLF